MSHTWLGGTDGSERVTHENIARLASRFSMIFFFTWQTDGRSGKH